jgi:hypothetical protein
MQGTNPKGMIDGALFDLGEAVYSDRTPHPQLNPVYARLDKAG